MAFIDEAFFKEFTGREDLPENFDLLNNMSSLLINAICANQLKDDLGNLPKEAREAVKKATAAQIIFLEMQGGTSAVFSSGGRAKSATIGKFSYSNGESNDMSLFAGVPICPIVTAILAPYGFLYRGADIWLW